MERKLLQGPTNGPTEICQPYLELFYEWEKIIRFVFFNRKKYEEGLNLTDDLSDYTSKMKN